MPFAASTSIKLTVCKRRRVGSLCKEDHQNRSRNVESVGRNRLTPLSKPSVTVPIFTKISLSGQLFIENFYTEFHENPTNGLLANAVLETDGMLSPRQEFLYSP
jgi:hypothetical protein